MSGGGEKEIKIKIRYRGQWWSRIKHRAKLMFSKKYRVECTIREMYSRRATKSLDDAMASIIKR